MLRNSIFISLVLVSNSLLAQTVGGSWFGRADVMKGGVNNNYITELTLKQKGNEVEGVFGYYFKDSYQSFFIRGSYDKNTRQVVIKNVPLLFYGSASTKDGVECPMEFVGTFMASKANSSIKGSLITSEKYKYTCPEIRMSMLLSDKPEDKADIANIEKPEKKFWKPQEEDFIVSAPASEKKVTIPADVTAGGNSTNVAAAPAAPETTANADLIKKFEARKNTYNKDLEIDGDSIRVTFYDNGDIDGDTISVFLNKVPVLVKKRLTDRSLNIYLKLDSLKEINEVSMFAENLGKYPPNTALMIITDGINRYETYLSSSLTQNASIRLKRKKKTP